MQHLQCTLDAAWLLSPRFLLEQAGQGDTAKTAGAGCQKTAAILESVIVHGLVSLGVYPKRGLTLWRRVDLIWFNCLAGEGQTPFRKGAAGEDRGDGSVDE